MSQWQGQVAVITGAGSGIGSGLARHAALLGMHVIAGDVDVKGLEALQQELSAKGQSIKIQRTDVSDPDSVEQLAQTSYECFGKVNLLFNNAGVLVDGKSWERSAKDWQWNLDVNIMGVVNGIRSFVPKMLEQGAAGRVVNTSSVGGLLGGGAYLGPYQASKHAVTAISETLFGELLNENAPITASVLCPGEVATGIWESDRLREGEEVHELGSKEEENFRNFITEGVAKGLTPDEFAARAFKGIESDKFWLLPQPDFKSGLQMRLASILEETNPLSLADMLQMSTGQ